MKYTIMYLQNVFKKPTKIKLEIYEQYTISIISKYKNVLINSIVNFNHYEIEHLCLADETYAS